MKNRYTYMSIYARITIPIYSELLVVVIQEEANSISSNVFRSKYIKEGQSLWNIELQTKLWAIVVMKDRAEGVLLQWFTDLPCHHPHLGRETGFSRAFLVLPSRSIDVGSSKASRLKNPMELMGGVIVEEKRQPWCYCPN